MPRYEETTLIGGYLDAIAPFAEGQRENPPDATIGTVDITTTRQADGRPVYVATIPGSVRVTMRIFPRMVGRTEINGVAYTTERWIVPDGFTDLGEDLVTNDAGTIIRGSFTGDLSIAIQAIKVYKATPWIHVLDADITIANKEADGEQDNDGDFSTVYPEHESLDIHTTYGDEMTLSIGGDREGGVTGRTPWEFAHDALRVIQEHGRLWNHGVVIADPDQCYGNALDCTVTVELLQSCMLGTGVTFPSGAHPSMCKAWTVESVPHFIVQ